MSDVISYDQLKDKRVMVPVTDLYAWEDNPKAITEEDFEQLRKDVHKRQFKPLIVTPDDSGRAMVLGGNQRLKAMQAEGITQVWISVVEFKLEGDKYISLVNGERDQEFVSKTDGMLHYALKDNEQRGFYQELELQELASTSELELSEYKVTSPQEIKLSTMVEEVSPPEEEEPDHREKKTLIKNVVCPECSHIFEAEIEL